MSQISIEELRGDRIFMFRVYDDDTEPVEPNKYRFFTVGVVIGDLIIIKGLSKAEITVKDYRALLKTCKKLGALWMNYTHNGREYTVKT
jgi:microcompartment protein CcmK/EutM